MDREADASGQRTPPAVAALYGWDLEHALTLADPVALLSEGFGLLAMDRPAATTLARRGLAFSTVEDWLARIGSDATTVRDLAASAAEGWSAHHPEDLTTDGVHWPELEHQVQPELWSTLAAGVLLASAFRAAGVTRLRFLHGHPVHLDALDAAPPASVPLLWRRVLSDIAEAVPLAREPVRMRMRLAVSRSPLGRTLRLGRFALSAVRIRLAVRRLPPAGDGGRTVLALAGRELLRSAPIVRRIHEHLGPAVVALPWMNSRELALEAGRLSPAPSLPTPRLERGSWRDERRLRTGVVRNLAGHDLAGLEAAREEVATALLTLARTWAMHARRLRWMRSTLRTLDARLVVAARLDVSYQVPVEAASALGVPVLTLPHGIQEWSPPSVLAPRSGVAHVAGIRNPTAAPGATRVSPDSLIEYEYPHRVRPPSIAATGRRLTILAVTDGFGAVNRPSTGIRTHGLALGWLARLAQDRSSDVRVLLKPHPGNPEDEQLLIEASERSALEFLSREEDLIALLGAADLVLGVNCHGTSLVHAVRSDVPVARLLTEDPADAKGALWAEPRGWSMFWNGAVTTVRDADELERLVDDLVARPDGLGALRDASRRAAAHLVPVEGQERLLDILDELLALRLSGLSPASR